MENRSDILKEEISILEKKGIYKGADKLRIAIIEVYQIVINSVIEAYQEGLSESESREKLIGKLLEMNERLQKQLIRAEEENHKNRLLNISLNEECFKRFEEVKRLEKKVSDLERET